MQAREIEMDKNRLCYFLRSRYPKTFGIRKRLQRLKVKRLNRHFLSEQEIEECERDASKKEEVIAPYLSRWEKYLRPAVQEMEDILENAPSYKDRKDKDVLRIDMMYCRLAYGFIPSEYAGFELENREPKERKEFVSDIDTNVFGYSVNDITQIQSVLDKGDSYRRFSEYFGRDALVVERKDDFTSFQTFVKKHPVFVKKAVFSSMGKGVELVDINLTGESEQGYFKKLIASGKWLLEECVIQHESMSKVNSSSVNTIRCMTFNTKDGIVVPYCFFKAGRNGMFVDNAGAGGIVVGVDPKTGICITDGFTEYGERFVLHPDTGVRFKKLKMPDWAQMIFLCKKIAVKYSDMRYLSFDMAYTNKGWLVIEVNEVGQFIIPQIVMKRGIKAELMEYFARMDKVI